MDIVTMFISIWLEWTVGILSRSRINDSLHIKFVCEVLILYLIFVGLSSPTRYNHVPMVTQAAPTLQLQPQLIAQVSCPVAIFFLL